MAVSWYIRVFFMKFQKNVGMIDRIFRVIFGFIFIAISLFYLTDLVSYVLMLVGFILIATAITGYCILYEPFKINTFGSPICDIKIGGKKRKK